MELIKNIKITYKRLRRHKSIKIEYLFVYPLNSTRYPPQEKILGYSIWIKDVDADYLELMDINLVYYKHIQDLYQLYENELRNYSGWEDILLVKGFIQTIEDFITRIILVEYDQSRVKFKKRNGSKEMARKLM